MNTTRKLAALAATLSLAAFGTAFAATAAAPAPANKATCEALTRQVDSALAGTKDAKRSEAARVERNIGEQDCKAGKYDVGSEHLRKALSDLGMKPVN